MGKKHIKETNPEEVLKEQKKIEEELRKEIEVKTGPIAIKEGRIYISSSYNNTILTLTNSKGQVLAWKSAGSVGFKGTKKGTTFAASKVAEAMANICKKLGFTKLDIFVKGIGAGRESALRTLISQGLNIETIKDVTPIPHDGCRPPKVRRV